MPNGRPGHHALTDIVAHEIATFGAEIDDNARRIQADASPEPESLLAAPVLAWPLKDGDAMNFDGLSHVLDKQQACVTAQRRQT
jgi:hypothetical protein